MMSGFQKIIDHARKSVIGAELTAPARVRARPTHSATAMRSVGTALNMCMLGRVVRGLHVAPSSVGAWGLVCVVFVCVCVWVGGCVMWV